MCDNQEDKIIRRETRQQLGSVSTVLNGVPIHLPSLNTITDTFYASGRKDCLVVVPVLRSKSSSKSGV